MEHLPQRRVAAPRKKFRGKRRYFRRVWREARSFALRQPATNWWDLWHYHADWPGVGNLRWSYRREHLLALVAVLKAIAATEELAARPFQAWISVSGRDAGEDATYLHTPNANQTAYPIRLADRKRVEGPLTEFFREALRPWSVTVWRSDWVDEEGTSGASFSVCADGVGEPLVVA